MNPAKPSGSSAPDPDTSAASENSETPSDVSNGHVAAAYAGDGLDLFVADEQTDIEIDVDRWGTLARRVLIDEGVIGDVEMSLLFVDEPSISALNLQFLGKEGPTDVLSFPIDEEASPRNGSPGHSITASAGPSEGYDDDDDDDDQPLMLGDVLICPIVAQRNAAEHVGDHHNGSLDDEIALLVVHGILHLLGMDHMEDGEAEEMEAREQVLLGMFYRPRPSGIADLAVLAEKKETES
jgi:probable rRNA maturation factor